MSDIRESGRNISARDLERRFTAAWRHASLEPDQVAKRRQQLFEAFGLSDGIAAEQRVSVRARVLNRIALGLEPKWDASQAEAAVAATLREAKLEPAQVAERRRQFLVEFALSDEIVAKQRENVRTYVLSRLAVGLEP